MNLICVITTIAEPTECAQHIVNKLIGYNGQLIVIGDAKGPKSFDLPNTVFLPFSEQVKMSFSIAKLLPTAHYARKNIEVMIRKYLIK